MPNELQYVGTLTQSGLTIVARLFANDGAQVGGDIACAETEVNAIYIADMPILPAGSYIVRFMSDGALLGQGQISWDGTKEIGFDALKNKLDDLDASVVQISGGDAIVSELPPVILTKKGWTNVSGQMEAGKSYELYVNENWNAWAIYSEAMPTMNDLSEIKASGIFINEQVSDGPNESATLAFNGMPIWVYTTFGRDGEPAKVYIKELN